MEASCLIQNPRGSRSSTNEKQMACSKLQGNDHDAQVEKAGQGKESAHLVQAMKESMGYTGALACEKSEHSSPWSSSVWWEETAHLRPLHASPAALNTHSVLLDKSLLPPPPPPPPLWDLRTHEHLLLLLQSNVQLGFCIPYQQWGCITSGLRGTCKSPPVTQSQGCDMRTEDVAQLVECLPMRAEGTRVSLQDHINEVWWRIPIILALTGGTGKRIKSPRSFLSI